jgi:hypothetical protein
MSLRIMCKEATIGSGGKLQIGQAHHSDRTHDFRAPILGTMMPRRCGRSVVFSFTRLVTTLKVIAGMSALGQSRYRMVA